MTDLRANRFWRGLGAWQRLRGAMLAVVLAVGVALAAAAGLLMPAASLAADTAPPTTPGNFQATVVSGDPVVTLSWAASTDAGGIKVYRVDRSLDQAGWTKLSDTITATQFRDTTSGFGLHYYYRVSAIDMAGNSSAWAATDVSTENVGAGPTGSSEATYTSSDKLAIAQLPAGMAERELSCSVNNLIDVNGKKVGTKDEPVVLGPYELACKTAAGSIVTDFKKSVTWTLDLKGKLTGLNNPTVYVYDANANGAAVKTSQFDSKGETMRVELPPNGIIAVRASTPKGIISLSLIAVILTVLGIVAAIIVFALNRKKKLEYEEYLRSKYYEL